MTQTVPVIVRRLSVVVRSLAGLIVLALAIGLFMLLRATRTLPPRTDQGLGVPTVGVLAVEPVEVHRRWTGYGSARSMDAVDVPALVSGRLKTRPKGIEDGAPIQAGQLLVQIEPDDYTARVTELTQRVAAIQSQLDGLAIDEQRLGEQVRFADEEVEIQTRQYERVVDAIQRNSGNPQEVDVRQAALVAATRTAAEAHRQLERLPAQRSNLTAQLKAEQAALARATRDEQRATIRAPISGRFQQVPYEADEWVPAGATVARIVDLSRIEVPLALPISAIGDPLLGASVTLTADGPTGLSWTGTIARIAPEADTQARSVLVYVEVNQDPTQLAGLLLPGQFVVGSVVSPAKTPQLIVPRRAVLDDTVLVVRTTSDQDDSASGDTNSGDADSAGPVPRAVRVPVVVSYHIEGPQPSLDPIEQQWAVIERGLTTGDRVIVSGSEGLSSGSRVEVVSDGDGSP